VPAKSGGPVEVPVLAGGTRLRRIVAKNEAGWFNVELEVPPDAPRDLIVTVAAPDAGARHFCVGGDFEGAQDPALAGQPVVPTPPRLR
jgi:hypothetical protein